MNALHHQEIERLQKLVAKGLDVVEDFMPNIAHCVLQDYGRMNDFLIEARKVKNALSDPGDLV